MFLEQDYAKTLSVHVNHLNRSVKEITGKATTNHIAERIITEAKILLQHTEGTIAEIAYAWALNTLTYFNNYSKRVAGIPPSHLRSDTV